MKYRILIANDHAAVALKHSLSEHLSQMGHQVSDLGVQSDDSVDYPDLAADLCRKMADDPAQMGVLICGSGIGMSMAANRFNHIRAALCHDVETAQLARAHNNANILVLGARMLDGKTALAIADIFFSTAFEAGRHQRRIDKMTHFADAKQ
jgi:ribose 5-phosphate isomerase B